MTVETFNNFIVQIYIIYSTEYKMKMKNTHNIHTTCVVQQEKNKKKKLFKIEKKKINKSDEQLLSILSMMFIKKMKIVATHVAFIFFCIVLVPHSIKFRLKTLWFPSAWGSFICQRVYFHINLLFSL